MSSVHVQTPGWLNPFFLAGARFTLGLALYQLGHSQCINHTATGTIHKPVSVGPFPLPSTQPYVHLERSQIYSFSAALRNETAHKPASVDPVFPSFPPFSSVPAMPVSLVARKHIPDYEIYKKYVFVPTGTRLCPPADAKGPILSQMDVHCFGDALW